MNFNDSQNDVPLSEKTAGRKSNDSGEEPGESNLDRSAMEGAEKAQKRQHQNENTNSGNSIFSK
jgi:hypothetical protein